MIQFQNWKGKINPLSDYDRYRVACCCCIKEDIVPMFQCMKQDTERTCTTVGSLIRFRENLRFLMSSGPLVKYWTHIICDWSLEKQLNGKNVYEYGLELVFSRRTAFVEAVEYFWDKIKALPENELSLQQKNEIIMKTADRAIRTHFYCGGIETFVFCVNEMSSDLYSEFLKKRLCEK